jgi:hypothetical protein
MIGFLKASSPEVGGKFGHSVALSSDGETLAVGAPYENGRAGAVYVFVKTSGGWTLNHKFSDGLSLSANDMFGYSLSLSEYGETLAVGAPYNPSLISAAPRNVYIFSKTSGGWGAPVNVSGPNSFGHSVSLSDDGTRLAVGANKENSKDGAAYLCSSASSWTCSRTSGVSGSSEEFGYSVSLSGDGSYLAVGAPKNNSGAGAAYVLSESNSWGKVPVDITPYAESGAYFGRVVSLSNNGQTLAVGADRENSFSGAVYVFSGGVWSSPQKVFASNGESNDSFGYSVSLSGDGNTLVVGAYQEDGTDNGVSQPPTSADQPSNSAYGAAYVYSLISGDWSEQAYLKSLQTDPTSAFGYSVSTNGETIAVGAYRETVDLKLEAGATYVF